LAGKWPVDRKSSSTGLVGRRKETLSSLFSRSGVRNSGAGVRDSYRAGSGAED
jgi:hypothetical protein